MTRTLGCAVVGALALLAPQNGAIALAAVSCESLASLTLPATTVTSAAIVAAGAFTGPDAPPANPGGAQPNAAGASSLFATLPAFCRVTATLKPSSDSDIKVEVWLPQSGWNGKFLGVPNGGWGGTISYPGLARAIGRGYAAASTDTGHVGTAGDASFALGHPEKVTDFAYRAVHEMTVQAKAIVTAFYGNAARLSYWSGCSTAARQGLKEAQRFPADFDGIIAGAPANYMTHLSAHKLWVPQAVAKDPSSFPGEKLVAIHKAVLDACDALDGVSDGVLEDPSVCTFDPKTIQCSGEDTPMCLTAQQVEMVRRITSPSKNPRTGADVFPGFEPGGELGWRGFDAPQLISNSHFKYIVFKNPDWDFTTLDYDKDIALADQQDGGELNAIDPNLRPFFNRGGKLLMYHGWSDPLVSPRNSINYYSSVLAVLGGKAAVHDSIRLFMVPGMFHCAGGDGTWSFDALGALEQWVEQKKAPDRIAASRLTKGVVDRTRPLCPYPQTARYNGTGSTDDEASFVCRAP